VSASGGSGKNVSFSSLAFSSGLIVFCPVVGSYNPGVMLGVCVSLFLAHFAIFHMISADFAAFSIFPL
jgi:hypothetical protein